MNNNDENKGVGVHHMTRAAFEGAVTSEISCDHTLPDYLPEIRRILYVTNAILPPAKYVGGGKAELDGTVDLSVLYVGADGGLYSAPVSCAYDVSVPFENASELDLNEGVILFATGNAESITARVSGPRRFTLRLRLRTYVRAYGKIPCAERYIGDVREESIQRLTYESSSAELVSALSDVISVSDEITGIGDETRVISADAKVLIEKATPTKDGCFVNGNVIIKLLCAEADGRIENISRKVAFEGEIETDVESESGEIEFCRIRGCVSELSVTVEEGKISCEASIMLDAQLGTNRRIAYIADAYSTDLKSDCEYANRATPLILRALNGNFSQSERIPLSTLSIPDGANAIDACASVLFDSCEKTNGKYTLVGKSKYIIVCEANGEYSVCEVELPVRYETDGADRELKLHDAVAEVISCRARVGGENLEIDSEIAVGVTFMGEENIKMLKSVEFTEPIEKDDGELILCYPSPDDTVWSVAKRYSVAVNEVSGDPNTDTYLIIR